MEESKRTPLNILHARTVLCKVCLESPNASRHLAMRNWMKMIQ